jgi:gas vesicle protein
MKPFQIALSVLAGAAAGTLVGILFAPHRGSKTQKKILEKGEACVDDLKKKFDESLDAAAKKYENFRQETDELVGKNKVKTNEMKKEGKV